MDLLNDVKNFAIKLERDGFVVSKEMLERGIGKILFIGRCSFVGRSKTHHLYKALNSGKKMIHLNKDAINEIKYWTGFVLDDPGLPMGMALNLPCTEFLGKTACYTYRKFLNIF